MTPEDTPILASAQAPGKVILLGEHSVVYGRAAIAVPVRSVFARAVVRPATDKLVICSRLEAGLGTTWTIRVDGESSQEPLAVAAQAVLGWLGWDRPPRWLVEVSSTIPLARGLGSSAAAAVALVRAMAQAAGRELSAAEASELAYQAEQQAHGTPSGIDNTVVAWDRPVHFAAGQARELPLGAPLPLVIADSGRRAPTRDLVAAVRERWSGNRRQIEAIFDDIQALVDRAEIALSQGNLGQLGSCMTENQACLRQLGVSDERLDALVESALTAGAWGAKLSGAGGGGVVIALVPLADGPRIAEALRAAGARDTIQTVVET